MPSRALQVTDVGLHRADGERGAAARGAAEDLAEGGGLHGVAHPGAGAVEFDVADAGGVDPGALVGGAQDRLLGGGVGVVRSAPSPSSLLAAPPRMTAYTRSPSARARPRSLRTTIPPPSPRT